MANDLQTAAATSKPERRSNEPGLYACGCSWLKVRAGKCDIYQRDGSLRPDAPTDEDEQAAYCAPGPLGGAA